MANKHLKYFTHSDDSLFNVFVFLRFGAQQKSLLDIKNL